MDYRPIKTLTIRNFQAIEAATIELGNLTVLVGAGESGKSSILRAFRALCLNDATDDDIRHGTQKAEVSVHLESDTRIDWWKKKGQGGCYLITSQHMEREFVKTGGQVPEEIAAVLGFGTIEVDSTTELTPQLSDQFDSPFILWETGSKRARILGKATRLDTVVTAQMACKRERDEANQMVKSAIDSLDSVCVQRNVLPDFTTLELRLEQCSADLDIIDAETARADQALALHNQIEEVRSRPTVDTGALRLPLDTAESDLDRLTVLSDLYNDWVIADSKQRTSKEDAGDAHGRLNHLIMEYAAACQEAGVCRDCGGLLSHKECKA